jgi:crescentin
MRLLSKNVRGDANKTPKPAMLVEGLGVGRPEGSDRLIEATQAIGVRYETIHGGLDSISRVVEHLRAIEPLLSEIRGPVAEEFEARRAEHAELIALRANYEQARASWPGPGRRARTVGQAGDRPTWPWRIRRPPAGPGRRPRGRRPGDRPPAQWSAAVRPQGRRPGRLPARLHLPRRTPGAGRRDPARPDPGHRRPSRRGRGRPGPRARSNALQVEEPRTLKKRLDQAGADVARLSRIETELEAQVAAERSRVLAADNALATASRPTAPARSAAWKPRSRPAAPTSGPADPPGDRHRPRRQAGRDERPDLGPRLNESSAQQQAVERRAGDLNVALERALERVRNAGRRGRGACAAATPASTPPAPPPSNAPTSWPRPSSPTTRRSSAPRNAPPSCAPASRPCRKRRTRPVASTTRRSPRCRPRSNGSDLGGRPGRRRPGIGPPRPLAPADGPARRH